jgi:hypothetical protein
LIGRAFGSSKEKILSLPGLDHHLDHRVGWVERSETQHFVFVGFRSSTQPTFHALDETMIKAGEFNRRLKKNVRDTLPTLSR